MFRPKIGSEVPDRLHELTSGVQTESIPGDLHAHRRHVQDRNAIQHFPDRRGDGGILPVPADAVTRLGRRPSIIRGATISIKNLMKNLETGPATRTRSSAEPVRIWIDISEPA